MFDAGELAELYQETGDMLTYTAPGGAVKRDYAIFSQPGQIVFDGGGVMITNTSIRYRTSIFSGVVKDGIWTLPDGTQWRVTSPQKSISDGQEAYVEVSKA